jgi:hypothetical protein
LLLLEHIDHDPLLMDRPRHTLSLHLDGAKDNAS